MEWKFGEKKGDKTDQREVYEIDFKNSQGGTCLHVHDGYWGRWAEDY